MEIYVKKNKIITNKNSIYVSTKNGEGELRGMIWPLLGYHKTKFNLDPVLKYIRVPG
jgi:hypothetical protein